jgi:molybdate transport system substrate-binding protein
MRRGARHIERAANFVPKRLAMATIKLLTSNSMRAVMDEILPAFGRQTGNKVTPSYDPGKLMMERIARGETGDVAILGGSAIETLEKQGKIVAGSRRTLARCGVGVAVRAGASKPDIGSLEAFKRALLSAPSVAYTQDGASGMHFAGLIERLGIAEEIKAKAVRQPGGLVGELVAAGKAAVAVQQIPELMAVPGVELVGPLPQEVQAITVSSAGIFAESKEPAAARAFFEFLFTPFSAAVLKAKGHETEG